MAEQQRAGIVLCGIKHSGKSAIGKELSRELNMPFLDLDRLIEDEFLQANGRQLSVREIYQQLGQATFQHWEVIALQRLLTAEQAVVLALGGGTPMNPKVKHEWLRQIGKVVLLDLDPEIAWQRVMAGGMPPFLQNSDDPKQAFLQMCQERMITYGKIAELQHQIKMEIAVAKEATKIVAQIRQKWPGTF